MGETAIPGAPACIRDLRARGKRLVVLTNAASYPHAQAVAQYRRLGFDFAPEEIVSSRDVCAGGCPACYPARIGGRLPRRTTGLRISPSTWCAGRHGTHPRWMALRCCRQRRSTLRITTPWKARCGPAASGRGWQTPISLRRGRRAQQGAGLFRAFCWRIAWGSRRSFSANPMRTHSPTPWRVSGTRRLRAAPWSATRCTPTFWAEGRWDWRTVLATDHGLFAGRDPGRFIAASGDRSRLHRARSVMRPRIAVCACGGITSSRK